MPKKNPKENVRLIKKLIDSGAKYKDIINYKCQSFLSLMGEAAIKDKYNEECNINKYRYINIEKENKNAEEKMEDYIKKNYKNKKNNYNIFNIIVPFIILIISLIINKFTQEK